MNTHFRNGIFALLLLLTSAIVFAQKVSTSDKDISIETLSLQQSDELNKATALEQINSIILSIEETKKSIKLLGKQIITTTLDSDKKSLIGQRQLEQEKLNKLRNALEQIATGAVDLAIFERTLKDDFSWQEELKEIFRPIIYELKKITEKPRKIDQLRNTISSLEDKINATNSALLEINNLQKTATKKDVELALKNLENKWQSIQNELKQTLQLTQFQLTEKLNNEQSRGAAIGNAFKAFFTGRGLNLILAVVAFSITFVLLRYISHIIENLISRGSDADSRFFARIVHVIFQFVTVILSILSLMLTLYILSDWLLLALLVLILIGAAFTLRNSLPKYIEEVRLLLNLGPVREGERVMYNNVPYKVSRLNIYTILVNPRLTGGKIRLPLRAMSQLISREWSKEESWFPTRKNDFALLSDGTFGKIEIQTPEHVHIRSFGNIPIFFHTSDYLELAPQNLSMGYGVIASFGLDYKHQPTITTDIPKQLKEDLHAQFEKTKFNQYLISLRVEFDNAGASSLDLKLLIMFEGEGAEFYYQIKRFIQKACVNTCNKHDWVIPFAQITVHSASTDNS